MISPECRAGKNGWRPLWLVAALAVLLPTVASAQFRTTWQMYTNSNTPICFSPKLVNQRDTNAFNAAYGAVPATPAATNVNWQAAPIPNTIGYTNASILSSASCSGSNGCSGIGVAGSYNFFQAYVYLPGGLPITNFSVVFASGVDDVARVTIYNTTYPSGVSVPGTTRSAFNTTGGTAPGSDIGCCGTGISTANLGFYLKTGESNRIVITQVDTKCATNALGSADFIFNSAALPYTQPARTVNFCVTIWDKVHSTGPIYEWREPSDPDGSSTVVTGMVSSTLGTNSFGRPAPIYTLGGGIGCNTVACGHVSNAYSFSTWFTDTHCDTGSNSVVASKDMLLPMLETSPSSGIFQCVSNNTFFPIDNQLCGNTPGYSHNFLFAVYMHANITFANASDYFRFDGDDDIWVFINNTLVIDLGSLHASQSATITAASLVGSGLSYGTQYPIDIFYCERQPTASTLNMYTTFSLFPDTIYPVIICASTNTTIPSIAGQCGAWASNVSLTVPTATDNCTVISVTSNAPAFLPVGTNFVRWQVQDGGGNSTFCTQTVVVVDTEAPIIFCPGDLTLTSDSWTLGIDASGSKCFASSVGLGTPSVGDNCSTVTYSNNATVLFPTGQYPVGTNTITWTAIDGSGNTATCPQKVIVKDTQTPFIGCPSTINRTASPGLCTTNVNYAVSASDNCLVTLTRISGLASGSLFPVGTNFVTWTATDPNGNSNTCTFKVIVTGSGTNSIPIITCPTNMIVVLPAGSCSNIVPFTVTAIDPCGGSITNIVSVPASNSVFGIGTTTVTNTAFGSAGKSNICTFTITVRDSTPPFISGCANKTVNAAAGTCTSNVTFNINASDLDCGGPVTVFSTPSSGFAFPIGVTTVTNIAFNSSGSTNTCLFNVTVRDRQPPTINCPSNLTVNAAAGLCSSNVAFTVTASDLCSAVTNLVSIPTNGYAFPVGTTTVTNTAQDSFGNSNVCTFTVTVLDTELPVITCPSAITVDAAADTCSSNVTFTVIATDNCAVSNLVSVPASGSAFPVGSTLVISTATDNSGNSIQCAFAVTVVDRQPPAINCPANLTVFATPGTCASNVTFTVTATDNCTNISSLISTPPSGSSFPIGTTTVTSTAVDNVGNSNSCTFTVTVLDKEAPVINCPPLNLTVNAAAGSCASNVTFSVTASDNCGAATVTSVPASGSAFPVGTNTVVSTAVDSSGNSNQCTFLVTVLDTQPPTITCPGDVTAFVNNACVATGVNLGTPGTADNCAVAFVTNNAPANLPLGTNFYTWTVTDTSGNTATCLQRVVTRDNIPPTITCPADIYTTNSPGTNVALNVILGTPLLTNDNCAVAAITNNNPGYFPVGTNTVTWVVADTSGNFNVCQQRVIVTNGPPPNLVCPATATLFADAGQCFASGFTLSQPTVTVSGCGNVVLTSNAPVQMPVGTNTVTWTATDQCNVSFTCQQTVIVQDDQPPVITCPTNRTVNAALGFCTSNVTFSVTATDNCGVISSIVSVPASGSAFPVGTTLVTSTATDSHGNSSQCQFTVTVLDKQPPALTCPPPITVNAAAGSCASNVTFSVIPSDNCGGIASQVTTPASGSAFPVGVTTVTSTATDTAGNSNSCTFTVAVLDKQPPAISCPGNITVNTAPGICTSNVTFTVTAPDNCAGAVTIVSVPASGSAFALGTTTVTTTATDTAGNSNTCTFTVTVLDRQSPIISCPANLTVNAAAGTCASNVAFTVTAPDNCAGAVTIVSAPASGSTFPVGTTVVNSTATDTAGNSNSCAFTVTVLDKQPPVLTCPSPISVNAAAGTCASNVTFSVSATDNCGSIAGQSSVPASGSAFPVGTTTVTNTATDNAGNSNTCMFTVTVFDTQLPAITCPPDITTTNSPGTNVALGVILGVPTTSDNCAVLSVASNAPASYPVGTNTVTWTVLDTHGNSNTCLQRVIVGTNAPPAINCPADVIVFSDAGVCIATGVTLGSPTVTFPGCGSVVVTSNAPASYPLGTNVVTWTATDSCGSSAGCQQRVIVADNQPPSIFCSGNLVFTNNPGQCSRSNVNYAIAFSDNCTAATLSQTAGFPSGSTFPRGVTTNRFVVTDGSGNTNTCSFTVTVNDTQMPTISCPVDVNVSANSGCAATNVALGAPVTGDNCGSVVVTSNAPASFPAGPNFVTWTVIDPSGNSNTCSQRVVVRDNTAPTITCPADVTVSANTNSCAATGVSLGTPTVGDNCAGTTITSNAPASYPIGTNLVTWTVTDSGGNSNSCVQKVIVRDNQLPTISCPGNLVFTNDPGQCSRSNVIYSVTSGDNCAGAVLAQTAGLASGSTFLKGVTTNRFTVTDASGNTNTCSFTVTVTDTQRPTITCPIDITVNANISCVATGVSLGTPVTADNCGVASLVSNAPAVFPWGTNVVTWTVTDTSGNTNNCTQRVIVKDVTDPTITCPPDIFTNNNGGTNVALNVPLGTPVTGDNCGVVNVANNSTGVYPIGTNVVTWLVTDVNGNIALCPQRVIVTNSSSPQLTCPAPQTFFANAGVCYVTGYTLNPPVVTSIGCGSPVVTSNAPAQLPGGTNTVTWTVTDQCGRSSSCGQTVIVLDNQPPTITCPATVTVSANSGCAATNVNLGTPTRADNCAIAGVTNNAPAIFPLGTNFVTWTVRDSSGNTNTCQQRVIVRDTTLPVIICPPDISTNNTPGTNVALNVPLGTPVTNDNCSIVSLTNNAPGFYPTGTNVVTWFVSDSSGNINFCQQRVIIQDLTPPSLTCPAPQTLFADAGVCFATGFTLLQPTITYTGCGGVVITSNAPPQLPVGTNPVIWTVTDQCGKFSSCPQTVIVRDIQPPNIVCQLDVTVSANSNCIATNVTLSAPLASDNCSVAFVTNNLSSFNLNPVAWWRGASNTLDAISGTNGTWAGFGSINTYASGVVGTAFSFDGTHRDRVSVGNPVALQLQNFTIEAWIKRNSATDVSLDDNFADGSSAGAGAYIFGYGCGGYAFVLLDGGQLALSKDCVNDTRVSTPVTDLNWHHVTVTKSGTTVVFYVDGVQQPVPTPSPYTNVFQFTSSAAIGSRGDGLGNTFYGMVDDLAIYSQVLTPSQVQNIYVAGSAGLCGTPTPPSVCGSPNFPLGTNTVIWTATDVNGNTNTCTQRVIVRDTTPPTITCPPDVTVIAITNTCYATNVSLGNAVAADNCAVASIVNNAFGTYPVGVNTVTWTATDSSGNTATCLQRVIVRDLQPPVINCPGNLGGTLIFPTDPGACTRSNITYLVSASDNCATVTLVQTAGLPSGSTFARGVTTNRFTVTDGSGNTNTCFFTIMVVDTNPPAITCPTNTIIVDANTSGGGATNVALGSPFAFDECALASVTNNAPAVFPGGTNFVTWIATDTSGNTNTCQQRVVVLGKPPTLTCPPDVTVFATNQCLASGVNLGTPVVSNSCGTVTVTNDASALYPAGFPLGTNFVTWTAFNNCGKFTNCQQRVIVRDGQGPTITCPGNLVFNTDPGRCSRSNVTYLVSATDNCTNVSLNQTSGLSSGSSFPKGVTTNRWVATDSGGNTSTCFFTVTVNDTQPPVITCPTDFTIFTDPGAFAVTNIALGNPIRSDNCGVASFFNNAPSVLFVGTNFVTWTAIDTSGNSSSCTQRVVVVHTCAGDLTATTPPAQTVCAGSAVQFTTLISTRDPATFAWKFNNVTIPGSTANSLVIPNATAASAGVYTVEIHTECRSVTNRTTLTVLPTSTNNPISFTNSDGITIFTEGEAEPYPSVITPVCAPGFVKKVTVKFYDFFHTFPRDVSALLVGPNGQAVMLMSWAGNGDLPPNPHLDLTFSDSAPRALPTTNEITSGTYLPTDNLPGQILLPDPAPGFPYATNLYVFNGINPNGPWSLYVYDAVTGDGGNLTSWSLTIEWQPDSISLKNPRIVSNGVFQAEVWGPPGASNAVVHTNVIQGSTNLVTWVPILTNLFTNTIPGVFQDIHLPPPLPWRFYRVLQLP